MKIEIKPFNDRVRFALAVIFHSPGRADWRSEIRSGRFSEPIPQRML